jgi:hypothetical protein
MHAPVHACIFFKLSLQLTHLGVQARVTGNTIQSEEAIQDHCTPVTACTVCSYQANISAMLCLY